MGLQHLASGHPRVLEVGRGLGPPPVLSQALCTSGRHGQGPAWPPCVSRPGRLCGAAGLVVSCPETPARMRFITLHWVSLC